jgi:3-hydroxyacyl-CoA dehydrogenase/3-hydroxy-2-methylbutyryl-CoA dehydrogenase
MNGLVALITGGASGLGLACIHRFLKQGISHIHFCDLPTSKGDEIVKSMDTSLVTYHPVDVTHDNEVEQMFKKIQEKHSKLNCLVQCAGIGVAFRCYNINVDFSLFSFITNDYFPRNEVCIPWKNFIACWM